METLELYVGQFNTWSLAGGHILIKEYVVYAFALMALICFLACAFEKRNKDGRPMYGRSDKHFLLLVLNWLFGSMVAFSLIYSGSIMSGIIMLALIYCIPWSREITCNFIAPFLNAVPKFFWNTSSTENKLRERKIRRKLYSLALVPYKKSA